MHYIVVTVGMSVSHVVLVSCSVYIYIYCMLCAMIDDYFKVFSGNIMVMAERIRCITLW